MKNGNAKKFMEAFENIDDNFLVEAGDYTMKKRFNFKPIIAVAACAAIALAAIPVVNNFVNTTPAVQGTTGEQNTPTESKVGEIGEYVAYDMGTHSGENDLIVENKVEMLINTGGTVYVEKDKVGSQKIIEYGGKKWIGTYEHTKISDYYGDDEYFYYGEDENGKGCSFAINIKTGVCMYFYTSPDADMSKEVKYTKDECFEIAVKYLSNYIDDAEAYELKYVYERSWENGYYFMMYRTIDGIATSDRVSIGVRKTGEVYTHVFHSLGEMKDLDVSAINMELLEKVVSDKVDTIYGANYSYTHGISHLELVKLANGTFVFDCSVEIEGKRTEESLMAEDTRFLAITIK